ncbi:MAG: hydrogenase [Selenomonadaceae bacterium]|nr:hydrogenase [Selenomonadaceae bacterium]
MEYLVVLLILVVFLQTRIMELHRATYLLAVQSAIIAGSCVIVGISAGGGGFHAFLPGLLTLGVKVLFIPWAILRLIGEIKDDSEINSNINVNYSSLAAALFLVMGYILADRLLPGTIGRDIFAATFLTIMTGLTLIVMRRRAIMQIVGLITLENGIYFFGLLMTEGLPLIVELGVFLDVLIAVVVLVILTGRMRLSFMTTDTGVMRKLKG